MALQDVSTLLPSTIASQQLLWRKLTTLQCGSVVGYELLQVPRASATLLNVGLHVRSHSNKTFTFFGAQSDQWPLRKKYGV